MKNSITYLKALWSWGANSQSSDVSLDRWLTRGVLCFLGKLARRIYSFGCSQDILGAPQSLHSSPSELDAKLQVNSFMRFAVVLTLIFTIGVGEVWGDTDTYDFNTNGITKSSGPKSGSVSTSSADVVFTSKTGNTTDSWTITFTGNTWYGYGKNNGVNFGVNSSKNKYAPHATLTSKSYSNVTDVVIEYGGANKDVTIAVSVGGTSFGSTTTSSGTSYTFSHAAATGAVVISVESSTNGQIKINSVTITCSDTPPCTPLGTINGSVSWSSTSATLTWDDIANVSSWTVACKNTSTSAAAGSVGSITTNGAGKKTCTITDLTCGGTGYTFTISATAASGYCDKSWELTGSTTACTDPAITVSPASLTGLDYIVGNGPSTAQSFTVSGSSLGADLVVTAPTNYEVCKTADGTYTSTISYTPSDGAVANTTAYIRLAAGLNVGTYNYAAASGLQVTSTGAKTRTAALNGTVTKADCAITFTDFNAVDHYEATLEYGSSVTVSYNYTYNGDGSFSISHSPATGKIDKANKTLTVSAAGIWTLNASATAGTNYSKPSDASAQIRVKCVDTYKDFIHNKTIKAYGSGTAVTDGKMEDWGSGYTVPYIEDNAEETSGSCQQTHYKFMGWVSEDDINIADGTFKTGWTLIQAGTESKLATTKTYYAVWAKLEE